VLADVNIINNVAVDRALNRFALFRAYRSLPTRRNGEPLTSGGRKVSMIEDLVVGGGANS
jgi:hypothetical protein